MEGNLSPQTHSTHQNLNHHLKSEKKHSETMYAECVYEMALVCIVIIYSSFPVPLSYS